MKKTLIGLFIILIISLFSIDEIDSLKTALKKADGKQKVDILLKLSGKYLYSKPETCLQYASQAVDLAESMNFDKGTAKSYSALASGYYLSDNYNKAIKFFQKALEIFRQLKDESEVSKILNNLGSVYNSQSDFDQAMEYFRESLRLKEKFNNKSGIARTLHNIARIYNRKGDYKNALEYLNRALVIRRQIKDQKRIAITLNEIGNVYNNITNYEKALQYYLNSLQIKEELGDKRGMAVSLNNIGNVHSTMNNHHKALEYFQKSLKLQKNIKNRDGMAYSYIAIGGEYSHQKDLGKALEYYQKALLIKKEIGQKSGHADVLTNIGNLYQKQDKINPALAYFQKALQIQISIDDKKGLASTYRNLAYIFYKLDQADKALNYYYKSIELAEITNSNNILMSSCKGISDVYSKKQNYRKAYEFFRKYTTVNDSIFNRENSKKIAEMQIKYETDKKEKEIELLSKEHEKQIQFRNLLIFITLLVFVVAILLFYLYRLKRKEIAHQKFVEEQITEINRSLEIRVQQELKKREQQQALLIQKSKLESLGRLSAGIAHEINQPVTRLSLGLDNILIRKSMQKLDDRYLENKCNELFEDIERIRSIIEHIRTFSRDQSSSTLEKIDINEVIRNSIQLIQTQYKNHNIELKLDLEKNIGNVLGNQFKLEQVILNMISNSKDSVDEKYENLSDSDLKKTIKIRTYKDGNNIFIEIIDNGLGIQEQEKENIFDPFYTTKSTDKGTGLGLSISYGIVKEMDGEITVQSKIGEYAQMKIRLEGI